MHQETNYFHTFILTAFATLRETNDKKWILELTLWDKHSPRQQSSTSKIDLLTQKSLVPNLNHK